MNLWLLIASALTYILGIGHSVLGEWIGERLLVKKIHQLQLFDENEKDVLAKRIVRLAWHATSITWCGLGTILLCIAFIELNSNIILILRIVSLTFLSIFFLSLTTAPKKVWMFLIISVTTWMGTC